MPENATMGQRLHQRGVHAMNSFPPVLPLSVCHWSQSGTGYQVKARASTEAPVFMVSLLGCNLRANTGKQATFHIEQYPDR